MVNLKNDIKVWYNKEHNAGINESDINVIGKEIRIKVEEGDLEIANNNGEFSVAGLYPNMDMFGDY